MQKQRGKESNRLSMLPVSKSMVMVSRPTKDDKSNHSFCCYLSGSLIPTLPTAEGKANLLPQKQMEKKILSLIKNMSCNVKEFIQFLLEGSFWQTEGGEHKKGV